MKTVAKTGLEYWRNHVNAWAAAWEIERKQKMEARRKLDEMRHQKGQKPCVYRPDRQPPFEVRDPEKAAQILHLVLDEGATEYFAHKETGVHALEVGRLVYRHKAALMAVE